MMKLLKKMLREEWRLHSTLFGNFKFALFPIIVFVISTATISLLLHSGYGHFSLSRDLHWIIFFLGLNVGMIGFVSKGGLENVLGKMNLLLYTSRTLPISQKKILFNFLAKDFIYYFFLFLLPIIAGVAITLIPVLQIPLLTFTFSLSFLTGIATTFFFTVLYRQISKTVFTILVMIFISIFYFANLGLNTLPSFQFYLIPGIENLLLTTIPIVILFSYGILFFDRETNVKKKKTKNLFRTLSKKMDLLNAKNIIDIHRSAGGFGKIIFSFVFLFVFLWFLITMFPLQEILLTEPLLVLATLLGTFPISIYSWLNRYDSIENYLHLPLNKDKVLKGKVASYFKIGPPLVLLAVLIGYLIFSSGLLELIHSLIIVLITSTSLICITVHLTELRPNAKMFDAVVLLKFIFLSSLVLAPFFITAIFYQLYPITANYILAISYLVIGTITYVHIRKILKSD